MHNLFNTINNYLHSIFAANKHIVSSQRWCKLRGNLLFYFKSNDQFSEPAGLIVLEKYRVVIPDEPSDAFEGFPFYIGK
jgi:inositol polyphosphate-4-phosphatase